MAVVLWRCFVNLVICTIFFSLINVSSSHSELIILSEDSWSDMMEGEWMVEFYAPWCPACKALQPVWEDFAGWSKDLDIKVAQVDVTTSPGLSGRFMVTALPTIFHVKDGVFRTYRGTRDKEEFISFIEDQKWKDLEEVSAWKSPSSFHMSIVSYFFKLSMVLRNAHTSLIEDYGLPNWGSYIIFAVGTIIIGAILGLLLVCVIDFFFPPKLCPREDVDKSHEPEHEESDLHDDTEETESDKEEREEVEADQDGELRRRRPRRDD